LSITGHPICGPEAVGVRCSLQRRRRRDWSGRCIARSAGRWKDPFQQELMLKICGDAIRDRPSNVSAFRVVTGTKPTIVRPQSPGPPDGTHGKSCRHSEGSRPGAGLSGSNVQSPFPWNGFLPILNGHNGHAVATHLRTSAKLPPLQSTHLARMALIGLSTTG
jgi:hypothetical protein